MWTTSFLLANIPRLFNIGNHEEIIENTKTLDWCLIPVGTVLFVPIIFEVQCPWNRPSIANILVIQAKCTTSTPFHQESTKKPPRIICSVGPIKLLILFTLRVWLGSRLMSGGKLFGGVLYSIVYSHVWKYAPLKAEKILDEGAIVKLTCSLAVTTT